MRREQFNPLSVIIQTLIFPLIAVCIAGRNVFYRIQQWAELLPSPLITAY